MSILHQVKNGYFQDGCRKKPWLLQVVNSQKMIANMDKPRTKPWLFMLYSHVFNGYSILFSTRSTFIISFIYCGRKVWVGWIYFCLKINVLCKHVTLVGVCEREKRLHPHPLPIKVPCLHNTYIDFGKKSLYLTHTFLTQ